MAVALGLEEFKNTILGEFLFESKCRFDFLVNELDSNIICVVVGVIMRKDPKCSLRSIFLDIPTWGFSEN